MRSYRTVTVLSSTESVVAQTLKRLYPHNPDHDFDPECARCNTLRPFRVDIRGECQGCGAVGRDPHHEECPF